MLRVISGLAVASLAATALPVAAAVITVPGDANPYLAGMPDGSTASSGDEAPDESPVEVTGLDVTSGASFTFAATGTVSHGSQTTGPEGGTVWSHTPGAQNGISDVTMPINALLGVFLADAQPDTGPAPGALDFGTAAARGYTSLSPELKQVFFIGDGTTSGGAQQSFVAPAGASRLFLGTMDGYGWYDNTGFYEATVNAEAGGGETPVVPLPATLPILFGGLGLTAVAFRRK